MQEAAIGIVFHSQDPQAILWVKRKDLKIWVLPGGGIEPSENPSDAVKREVFEETGLEVNIVRDAAVLHPKNRWTAKTHLFICSIKSGYLKSNEESEEVAFFPVSSPPSPYFSFHQDWLEEVLSHSDKIERSLDEFSWVKVGFFFFKHPLILSKYLWYRIWREST